jgi:hypothetical protein
MSLRKLRLVGIVGLMLFMFVGCSSKQADGDNKKADSKKDDQTAKIETTEKAKQTDDNNDSEVVAELRKCIDDYINVEFADYITDDGRLCCEVIDKTIIEDFNGDGKKEMIIELRENDGEEEHYKQHFIYTNGTNTYRFGSLSTMVGGEIVGAPDGIYIDEVKTFLIETDNGEKHFAFTTSWVSPFVGKAPYYTSGIYKLDSTEAKLYLLNGYLSLDNAGKGSIEVTYYDNSYPHDTNTVISKEEWKWNGNDYDKIAK